MDTSAMVNISKEAVQVKVIMSAWIMIITDIHYK